MQIVNMYSTIKKSKSYSTNQIASYVVARDDWEGHESVLIGYFSSCFPTPHWKEGVKPPDWRNSSF